MSDDEAISMLLSEIEGGAMPERVGVKRASWVIGFSLYTRWCEGPRNSDYVLYSLGQGLRIFASAGDGGEILFSNIRPAL